MKQKICDLYLFSDNCPSDWISTKNDENFYTFATITAPRICELENHLKKFEKGLPRNKFFQYKDLRSEKKSVI